MAALLNEAFRSLDAIGATTTTQRSAKLTNQTKQSAERLNGSLVAVKADLSERKSNVESFAAAAKMAQETVTGKSMDGPILFTSLSSLQPIVRPMPSELIEAKSRLMSRSTNAAGATGRPADATSKSFRKLANEAEEEREEEEGEEERVAQQVNDANNNNNDKANTDFEELTESRPAQEPNGLADDEQRCPQVNEGTNELKLEQNETSVEAKVEQQVTEVEQNEFAEEEDKLELGSQPTSAQSVSTSDDAAAAAAADLNVAAEVDAAPSATSGLISPCTLPVASLSSLSSSPSPAHSTRSNSRQFESCSTQMIVDGDESTHLDSDRENDHNNDDDDDHFCARPVSDATLRRLRKDALEDVQVCDESRASTRAARKLFATAGAARPHSSSSDDASKRRPKSAFEARQQVSDELELLDARVANSDESDAHSSGSIRLSRGTALGASNGSTQFGRHLVCCVSPIGSQSANGGFRSASSCLSRAQVRSGASTPSAPERRDCDENCDDSGGSCAVSSSPDNKEPPSAMDGREQAAIGAAAAYDAYPLDVDEVRLCKAAFRENKRRLIESQVSSNGFASAASECDRTSVDSSECALTDRARPQSAPSEWHLNNAAAAAAAKAYANANANLQTNQTASALMQTSNGSCKSGLWRNRLSTRDLNQRDQFVCSKCKQRLYPMDKLELDFTRTRLNIHRNCFKCHICSTLLR